MAGPFGNDAPRGGAAFSLDQPQHSTRSWTSSDGTHYTVDSTTYATPGLRFGAFSGTVNRPFTFDPFMSSSSGRGPAARTAPFGLLGNAFGLLESALTMHSQHSVGEAGLSNGNRRRAHIDNEGYDADLAYESDHFAPNRRARPKSIFSRLKDRLVDVRQLHREDSSSSRERSSGEEHTGRPARRQSTHRNETRQPTWEVPTDSPPDFIEVDYQDETESEPEPIYTHSRSNSRAPQQSTLHDNMIEALENTVELEKRNVRACKQKLAHASRQANISSSYLQRIVDEIKQHETTLATATSDLNEEKARRTRSLRPEMPPRQHSHPRPGMPPRQKSHDQPTRSQPRHSQSTRNMHDHFFDPFAGFPSFSASRHPDPIFQAFQNLHGVHADPAMHFDPFFGQPGPPADDPHFHYFAVPGGPFHAEAVPNTTRKPSGTNFARPLRRTPAAPAQPPATVLRSDEAKRLFPIYNERWNSLPPMSPDIPYPARGLHAGGLAARDSIWAPNVSVHVATWSEETVMQANAQAFYLGVVGLSPSYTQNPASGRVEVGFDNARASPAQLQQLVDILKKEKTRWHSDRLGRRNGGKPGPNEALQKDERARAVFHAVCELMEAMQ
ncbi:hypothetical protein Slin15195_G098890 [Septoria linicola]|uniref:Uncharacterized protein n=1 Tax=Septoria linicola TaxID=215465 RepID=A0A9Q9AWS3_9PEZI|nr:hypothetical protein Slin15195_G098890 [Septoria linicola]